MKMCLTGDPIDAKTALQAGLVAGVFLNFQNNIFPKQKRFSLPINWLLKQLN